MVHVSEEARHHKMLAFSTESSINVIDNIIVTTNGKEQSSNASTATTSSLKNHTNGTSSPPTATTNTTHLISEESLISSHNTKVTNSTNNHHNGCSPHKKNTNMITDEDNCNANIDIDTTVLNANRNMNRIEAELAELMSSDNNSDTTKLLDNDNNTNTKNRKFIEEIVPRTPPPTSTTMPTKSSLKNKASPTNSSNESTKRITHHVSIDDAITEHKKFTIFDENAEIDSEESPLLAEVLNTLANTSTTNTLTESNGTETLTNQKVGKLVNGAKSAPLKRVSFGSSKGSMVETLIYESSLPCTEEHEVMKTGNGIVANGVKSSSVLVDVKSQDSTSGGSTGGSSRVRVTFFESSKPLQAVSSPESDFIDFDLSRMTLHGSPNADHPASPYNNRQLSVEGWDNPFRPDGDLSKEADQIVELIKEGKPINDENLRSKSPSVNDTMHSNIYTHNQLNASPKKDVNGSAPNGGNEVIVQAGAQPGVAEHVVLKKKKGCCVIQ